MPAVYPCLTCYRYLPTYQRKGKGVSCSKNYRMGWRGRRAVLASSKHLESKMGNGWVLQNFERVQSYWDWNTCHGRHSTFRLSRYQWKWNQFVWIQSWNEEQYLLNVWNLHTRNVFRRVIPLGIYIVLCIKKCVASIFTSSVPRDNVIGTGGPVENLEHGTTCMRFLSVHYGVPIADSFNQLKQ